MFCFFEEARRLWALSVEIVFYFLLAQNFCLDQQTCSQIRSGVEKEDREEEESGF